MKNISLLVLVAFVFAMSFTTGCATKNNYGRTTETYFPDGKLREKQVETDKSWSVNQPFAGTVQPARVVVVNDGPRHINVFSGGFRIGGGPAPQGYAPSGFQDPNVYGSPIRNEPAYRQW
jgi:hypothetical protein